MNTTVIKLQSTGFRLYRDGGNRPLKKRPTALYRCFCGNTFEAVEKSVYEGHTKSCGCIKKSRAFWESRMQNLLKYHQSRKSGSVS